MNRKLVIIALVLSLIVPGAVLAQATAPTPTATATATPTATPLPTLTLTLFRDADSLTLLVPPSDVPVSLLGLELRVSLINGTTITRRLDRDYAAFIGLPFANVDELGAVCFRLVKAGATGPLPIECGNGPLLLTQQLAAADVFWFDSSTNLPRIVQVRQNNMFIGLCPATQDSCAIELPLLPVTATPTPSLTPTTAATTAAPTFTPIVIPTQGATSLPIGYPCEATIVTDGIATVLRDVLRSSPSERSASRGSIRVDERVLVLGEPYFASGNKWFEIGNYNGNTLGWIIEQYLRLSASCPI